MIEEVHAFFCSSFAILALTLTPSVQAVPRPDSPSSLHSSPAWYLDAYAAGERNDARHIAETYSHQWRGTIVHGGSWNIPVMQWVAGYISNTSRQTSRAELLSYVERQGSWGLGGQEMLSRLYLPWTLASLWIAYDVAEERGDKPLRGALQKVLRQHHLFLTLFAVAEPHPDARGISPFILAPGMRSPSFSESGFVLSDLYRVMLGTTEPVPQNASFHTRHHGWPMRVARKSTRSWLAESDRDLSRTYINTVGRQGVDQIVERLNQLGTTARADTIIERYVSGDFLAWSGWSTHNSTPPILAVSRVQGKLAFASCHHFSMRTWNQRAIGKGTAHEMPSSIAARFQGARLSPEPRNSAPYYPESTEIFLTAEEASGSVPLVEDLEQQHAYMRLEGIAPVVQGERSNLLHLVYHRDQGFLECQIRRPPAASERLSRVTLSLKGVSSGGVVQPPTPLPPPTGALSGWGHARAIWRLVGHVDDQRVERDAALERIRLHALRIVALEE